MQKREAERCDDAAADQEIGDALEGSPMLERHPAGAEPQEQRQHGDKAEKLFLTHG